MTRERRQQISHALFERAHLRVDEDFSDERVGRHLDQLLSYIARVNLRLARQRV